MILKQFTIFITLILLVIQPTLSFAKEDMGSGVVDDSIRDMSIVMGTGLVGAILGLSTLSFVDEPSKHTKNIAVGGAIGIVCGVAAVIFYQASKTTIGESYQPMPLTADQFASISKQEFQEYRLNQEKQSVFNQNEALRILLPF
jgi:hypothetical protein